MIAAGSSVSRAISAARCRPDRPALGAADHRLRAARGSARSAACRKICRAPSASRARSSTPISRTSPECAAARHVRLLESRLAATNCEPVGHAGDDDRSARRGTRATRSTCRSSTISTNGRRCRAAPTRAAAPPGRAPRSECTRMSATRRGSAPVARTKAEASSPQQRDRIVVETVERHPARRRGPRTPPTPRAGSSCRIRRAR